MADISSADAPLPISPVFSNHIEEQFKEMCFNYILLYFKHFSIICEAVYLFIEVYECASYGSTLVSGPLNEEEYTKTVIVSIPFRLPIFVLANVRQLKATQVYNTS